jgi:hypothetical protein
LAPDYLPGRGVDDVLTAQVPGFKFEPVLEFFNLEVVQQSLHSGFFSGLHKTLL